MAKNNEIFNRELHGFLLAQNSGKVQTKDSNGEDVPKPEMADQFAFHYKHNGIDYGTVIVTTHGGTVKVFYNKSSLKGESNFSRFLAKLKDFSLRHGQMRFKPEDLDNVGDEMTRRKQEQKEEKLLEGYYGTKHTSYSDSTPPSVKMIIKHSKALEETDARFRYVEKIFLETDRGERLLLPTKKPSIGRVFARHLAEGGEYNDDRWKHLNEIAEDVSKLGGFIRATRTRQFNESVTHIIAEANNHYYNLRETVRKLQSSRGYQQYFESWQPTLLEQDQDSNYGTMFISSSLDPRIEAAIPVLNKLNIKVNEISEANEFESWANSIVEEANPIEDKKIDELVKLLTSDKEVAVGPDGNVIHQLKGMIDNVSDLKDLANDLRKVANADPDHDAKPVIISWLQQNSDDRFYGRVLDKLSSTDQAPAEPPPAAPAKPKAPAAPAQTQPVAPAAGMSPEDMKKMDAMMPVAEQSKKPAQRNFVAKHAQRSGAGSHGKKGFQRHDKHKKKLGEEGVAEGDIVQFPKKHPYELLSNCPKCGGQLQGGKDEKGKLKLCMPCMKIYRAPNQQDVAEGYGELDNLKAKFEERVASIIARAKAEGRELDQLTDREKKAIAILKGENKEVKEGSEWETRHDEFVTVGDRATPEQIDKIVKALIDASKQASGKRGFLNQIVGKQSNGDLARMAHGAETLAKNIQKNRNAKPGTDERKELGQHLVYAVSLLKKMSGKQGVAEGSGPQLGDEVYYGTRLVGTFKGYSKLGKIITEPNVDEMGDEYLNKDAYWDPQDKITIKPKQGVAEGSEDPSYKKGWKLCDKDPSADPQHLFRRHGEGLDRNQFIKGFNDNAKLRGMSIYGDVSGDVDHSTLRYKEFKRDQGVAEGGILKSIKRGLQGWDKNAVGPGGEKLGNPRDIVKRAKAMDTDTAKKVRAGLDAASDHSPAGLQKRVLDRKLKGVAEDQLDELKCWDGYKRVPGTTAGEPGSCEKISEDDTESLDAIKRLSGLK